MHHETSESTSISTAAGVAASALFAVLAILALAFPAAGHATFAGTPGAVAFSARTVTKVLATEATETEPPVYENEVEGGIYAKRGNKAINRLTESAADVQPQFSPDGEEIAFVRNGDVYLMRADGTGQRRLTDGGVLDSRPLFAPNGRFLLFERRASEGAPADLFTIRVNGLGLKGIVTGPDDEHEASFSPDGRAIVFVRTRAEADGPNDDIWSVLPSGSGLAQLTMGDLDEFSPHYYRDGIVFNLGIRGDDPSAYADIFTMARNGRSTAEVAAGPGSEYVEDVSPNGKWLIFRRDQGIWVKRIASGGGRELANVGDASAMHALFSPDSRRIATYVSTESQNWISSIATSDGESDLLTRGYKSDAAGYFIDPDLTWQPIHRCRKRRATIVGTPGRDSIRGTSRDDVIVGLGGNDRIRGLGGRDVICGNAGRDVLDGGRGRDFLNGGRGRDRVRNP